MTTIAPHLERAPIRLGMPLIGGTAWRGGLNYQRTVLSVIADHLSSEIEAQVFVSDKEVELAKSSFGDVLTCPLIIDNRIEGAGKGRRALSSVFIGQDKQAAALFDEHCIDVVFENARFFGHKFKTPAMAWIPDLQHRFMPHLFSLRGRLHRELGFRAQSTGRRITLLSSLTARNEYRRFYPSSGKEAEVAQFAPLVDVEDVFARRDSARERHNIPPLFFYVPNQFWAHKNHSILLAALVELKRQGQLEDIPPIIMSGPTVDNRDPGRFENFMSDVDDQGLTPWIRHLGMIPMQDVLALNANAHAVINPSLFEGWASSVEEAKSLGSRLILSDISVHREQAEDAFFFDPAEPTELAQLLREIAGKSSNQTRDVDQIIPANTGRREAFAKSLLAATYAAYAKRKKGS